MLCQIRFLLSREKRKQQSRFPTRLDKPGCTATEKKLEILNLRRTGIYDLRSKNKGAVQLCSYCTADLCLCFHIGKNLVLS